MYFDTDVCYVTLTQFQVHRSPLMIFQNNLFPVFSFFNIKRSLLHYLEEIRSTKTWPITISLESENLEITCGYSIDFDDSGRYPVYNDLSKCTEQIDAIIDFSHPSALDQLLKFAVDKKLPIVIATTGLSNEQIENIKTASEQIPVFYTANMSLGVNLLLELAAKAARVLGNDFDIEIIEKHHNKKIDAPSGTALMIADTISDSLDHAVKYEYDRQSRRAKRDKNEIGIHAVRGGTIVGEHDILFAGRDEIITISHTALSKEVFATGSINAAKYLIGKQPGLYNMKNMLWEE